MSLRKAFCTTAATAALIGAGLLTAPAAQAAEKPTEASVASVAVAPKAPAPMTAMGEWEYYTWYWTYASCHEHGQDLVANNGRWTDYTCVPTNGNITVHLYLWKP